MFTVALAEDGLNCALDFLFLDYQQGARLSILHTGSTSDDVVLVGRVMGGQPIVRVSALETGDPVLNLLIIGLVNSLRRLVAFFQGDARSARASEWVARLLVAIIGVGFLGLIIYGWQQIIGTGQRLSEQPNWPSRIALMLVLGVMILLSLCAYRLLQAVARRVERRRTRLSPSG